MKIFAAFFFFFSLQMVFVDHTKGQTKDEAFEISPKYISLLFVSDPKCPLQISGPTKLIGYTNGGFSFGYTLQNTSSANVESFLIEEKNWFGEQGYSHPSEVKKNRLFVPFMTDYTLSGEETAELIPFNKKTAEKSGISRISNKIWIVMVVKVKLSDGTIYDVSSKYQALENFIDKLGLNSKMPLSEINAQEQKLRDFTEKIMTTEN